MSSLRELPTRALRRHQAYSHMNRRLSEDRNQHYDDLTCSCWNDPRAMARYKEQPKRLQSILLRQSEAVFRFGRQANDDARAKN